MDLITARLLTKKSQSEIERKTGVFQTKLSRFEKNGIECIREDENEKIEKYLGLRINWEVNDDSMSLTQQELNTTKSFIDHFMKRDEDATRKWVSNHETSTDLYDAVLQVFSETTTKILGIRYPDNTGVPNIPEERWKDGKPDFSHIED